VTSLQVQQLGAPSNHHDERVVAFARERAVDDLSGRVTWCYATLPDGRAWARLLQERLEAAGAGRLQTRVLEHPADVSLIGPGDVVLFLDAVAARLAPAVREQRAHALRITGCLRRRAEVIDALDRRAGSAVDAYLWMRPDPTPAQPRAAWIEALMPVSDRLSAKRVDDRRDVAWASVLADVACDDRRQTVGGRFGARPAVPVR
jgi:hypothetical protein